MNNRIANFFSHLFHPMYLPVVGIFIVIWNDPILYFAFDTPELWIKTLGMILICTTLLPMLLCWVLLKSELITSLETPTDKDRQMMLMFTELGFLLCYLAYYKIPPSGRSISLFMLGINIAMVATLLISFVQKTSFHATGAGGILGTTMGLMYYTRSDLKYWIIGALLLCVVSGYSRYKLKAHNSFEIYLGFIIGILSLFLVFVIGAHHFSSPF